MSLVTAAPWLIPLSLAREYYKGLMMVLMMMTAALYSVCKLMRCGKVSHVMLPCIVMHFFSNNQPDALIIQIYSVIKLHVSGISAHHQEFSTVHSALVSFMQVSDDHFQAESGWNSILTLLGSGHQKPA